MFGISGTELLIVGVFAFIIFGPDKIPEIIRTVNKTIAMFKHTQEEMERTIKAEMYNIDPEASSLFGSSETSESADADHAKKSTTASSLYGLGVAEEEEDEE